MSAESFELFSKYWAGPLVNAAIVLIAILLLYPLIWRLTIKQLTAAISAIETAKELPATIDRLNDASAQLIKVNQELTSLKEVLVNIDSINDSLEVANRRLADLQRAADLQRVAVAEEPAPLPDKNGAALLKRSDVENWETVGMIWREVKDRVEAMIDRIPDGRVRRKYNTITRYQYAEVASFLRSDGLLTQAQANALMEMDGNFRSIRNRRTEVTQNVLDQFVRWQKTFEGRA
jgi:hypothetical protein